MLSQTPARLLTSAAYDPICRLLDGVMLTTAEVAARWRYTDDHLANLRRAGKGIPFVKFDAHGGVRYRAADVIGAELATLRGPLFLDDVLLVVAGAEHVPAPARAALIEHLRKSLARQA